MVVCRPAHRIIVASHSNEQIGPFQDHNIFSSKRTNTASTLKRKWVHIHSFKLAFPIPSRRNVGVSSARYFALRWAKFTPGVVSIIHPLHPE